MLFLAAEIDFFKWNCVQALEPSLTTLWRHWLYSCMKRYGFSLVFTWFIQVYSSFYRYLLVLHLVISVQPWQKIHVIDVNGHQSVDWPKWTLQIRTAQYILFDYLEYTIGDFEDVCGNFYIKTRILNTTHLDSERKLALPKPRTNYLKRSFSYSGATLSNNLPWSLKSVGSVDQSKRNLKKLLAYRIPTRQSCKAVVNSFSF